MGLKVNQRVVCLINNWYIARKILWIIPFKQDANGPKKGDILTIKGFNESGFLIFDEWSDGGYDPIHFRPLDEDFANEVIKNIIEKVKTEQLEIAE